MATTKSITVETDLYGAERLPNSTNGNPRFTLLTGDGSYRTQADAACSYDVDNITRRIPDGGSIRVQLRATPTGRVWDIQPI